MASTLITSAKDFNYSSEVPQQEGTLEWQSILTASTLITTPVLNVSIYTVGTIVPYQYV